MLDGGYSSTDSYTGHSIHGDTAPVKQRHPQSGCVPSGREDVTAGSLCAGRATAIPFAAAFNVDYPFISMSWLYKEHVTHETRFVGVLRYLL